MAEFQGGYSPAGAGLSKLGDLLLGFLMQKMQSDVQKKQFDSSQSLEKQRIEMAQKLQQFQMAQTQAQNVRQATGPMGALDATGVKALQDAGQGASVAGNLASKDLTPTQSPLAPTEDGTPQLSPMQSGETKPSMFYLKPTFFEDQQMQQAGREGRKDEMIQSFLSQMNPAQRGKALTGVDISEPSYAEKLKLGQTNDIEKIKLEHTNKMAEIDEQSKKAVTLGDKQLMQDVLKMWIAEKPDKTLEEGDPTVHDRWVVSGTNLLRGLGENNKSIKAFIDYLDKQGAGPVGPPPDDKAGLGTLPALTGPKQDNGPSLIQRFLKGIMPVGSPSGSTPASQSSKPGFKYDTGCLDKAGKFHADSSECKG